MNKEQKKRLERIQKAKCLQPMPSAPAKGSRIFRHLKDAKRNGHTKFALYCRTSNTNNIKQKVKRQDISLRSRLQNLGFDAGPTFSGREPGWAITPEERTILAAAVEYCSKYDLALIALTPSRFLRSPLFHFIHDNEIQPSIHDQTLFLDMVGDLALYTVSSPNICLQKDELFLQRMALEVGNPMQDPTRKAVCLPLIIQMHFNGYTLREIKRKLEKDTGFSVDHTTIAKWLRTSMV